jgi:predicted nucleic acid-binding protein
MAVRSIEHAEQSHSGTVITSQLARLECRVKPMRDGAADALARFDAFFARPGLLLAEVSPRVLERATELRAQHGFKTPDAIHLATALVQAADVFLTGDTSFSRYAGIKVEILDPASPP